MLLHVRHETRYRYQTPVNYSIQNLRLTPRNDPHQRTRDWRLNAPGRLRAHTDAYGNLAHTLTLTEPHDEIVLRVEGWIDIDAAPWLTDDGRLPVAAFLQQTPLTRADVALSDLGTQFLPPGCSGGAFMSSLEALMAEVSARIRYQPGATDVGSSAAEALSSGSGVCQDHAHVMLACARAAGRPGRYVSGYLHTGDDSHLASHAWADIWDGERWIACDATHRRFADARYCRLAVGRDYLDACPVRGMRRGGGDEHMATKVQVLAAQQ